jgi:hypothetical protein
MLIDKPLEELKVSTYDGTLKMQRIYAVSFQTSEGQNIFWFFYTHVNRVAEKKGGGGADGKIEGCEKGGGGREDIFTYKSSPLTFAKGVVRFKLPVACSATALS